MAADEEDDLFAMFCGAVAEEHERREAGDMQPEVAIPARAVARPKAPVELAPRQLEHSPELVDMSGAGDLEAVRRLMAAGADPNTIHAMYQRMTQGECCAGTFETNDEYTPLVKAAMAGHSAVVEALLADGASANIVCCGIDESLGPYKYYTALDMARLVKDSISTKFLVAASGKSAGELPEPEWPRATSANTGKECGGNSSREAAKKGASGVSRPAIGDGDEEAKRAMAEIIEDMEKRGDQSERARQFKHLLLKWHPDKRPEGERELATTVFQWLNGPARCLCS